MAVSDGMAANLEAEDQKTRVVEKGEEILKDWEESYRNDYTMMTSKISTSLRSSLWIILGVSFFSVLVATHFGQMNFLWPVSIGKLCAFIGSALVGWAALMELGGNIPVWDGDSFPQLVHVIIFKAIFIPGVFLVLTSIVI